MESGNTREPTRANDPEEGNDRNDNNAEDGCSPKRRGTFGRVISDSRSRRSSVRQEDTTEGYNFMRRGTFGFNLIGRTRKSSERQVGPSRQNSTAHEGNVSEMVADPAGQSPGQTGETQAAGNENGLDKTSSQREDVHARVSRDIEMQDGQPGAVETPPKSAVQVSKAATELYTLSYLVFFAIFGTLARLGLQALTTYPDAPVSFGVLWANVGGSLIMGFLAEDRKLFRYEWGTATYDEAVKSARGQRDSEATTASVIDLAAAKKAHLATKKTIPLYIGLATGFCGSFTSFSSFIRDVFLAMSNDLPGAGGVIPTPRNGGYSFMALLAVVITTVSLSLSALFVGTHLAAALEPIMPSIPYPFSRKILDRAAVLLGWGGWLGAIFLSIWPPHDAWRGQAVFSLVFAPLGCLARFYASLWLNSRIPTFPLGTFTVNIAGVAVLGMCWDIGHAGIGGLVGCQVLQGVEDGFCGCLTTVSTWVAELAALRRRHAYTYGAASVVAGFAILLVIMGGLRWSDGFQPLVCIH